MLDLRVFNNGKPLGYLHTRCRTDYECFVIDAWDGDTPYVISTLRAIVPGGCKAHYGQWNIRKRITEPNTFNNKAECLFCGQMDKIGG